MKKLFAIIALVVCTFNVSAHDALSPEFLKLVSQQAEEVDKQLAPFADNTRASRLAARLGITDVKIKVTSGLTLNAAYSPGTIYIGSDLMLESDETVAFIIAHEYGHHVHAHWRVNLLRGMAHAAEDNEELNFSAVVINTLASETPAERQAHETEADIVGATLASQAGLFDEIALSKLFSKLAVTDTHPETDTRMKSVHQAHKAWAANH